MTWNVQQRWWNRDFKWIFLSACAVWHRTLSVYHHDNFRIPLESYSRQLNNLHWGRSVNMFEIYIKYWSTNGRRACSINSSIHITFERNVFFHKFFELYLNYKLLTWNFVLEKVVLFDLIATLPLFYWNKKFQWMLSKLFF